MHLCLFPSGYPTKTMYTLVWSYHVLHVQSINFFDVIWHTCESGRSKLIPEIKLYQTIPYSFVVTVTFYTNIILHTAHCLRRNWRNDVSGDVANTVFGKESSLHRQVYFYRSISLVFETPDFSIPSAATKIKHKKVREGLLLLEDGSSADARNAICTKRSAGRGQCPKWHSCNEFLFPL
jgi:hypothetical protein